MDAPRRKPGRPPTGEPRRVTVTTTLPAALVDWLRGVSAENGIALSRLIQRGLLELKKKIDKEGL